MTSLRQLAALLDEKWRPWAGSIIFPSKPATERSVSRIEKALRFKLPKDFIELSRLSLNYGVHLGSIGEDYQSHNHLLRLNEGFHDSELQAEVPAVALPADWVIINHGHDGACDCFDIADPGRDGEYPIYYLNNENPKAPKLLARTFMQYLIDYA